MSLLGKIFTGIILVTSIIVMVIGMAVYSTHINWRDEYQALNTKLNQAESDYTDQKAAYLRQISQLEAEKEAAKQEARKLETERVQLVEDRNGLQTELEQAANQISALQGTVTSTSENNRLLSEEVQKLRSDIRTAQQERDQLFATTLKATTDLHTTAGELNEVKDRNAQLVQDLAMKNSLLRENDIDPTGEAVPRVRGVVAATRRTAGKQLIEISIGADDGVKKNQTVEIFRGERYLGRAMIIQTNPDRAVGQVLREYQQGPIQEGDDVATQLRS